MYGWSGARVLALTYGMPSLSVWYGYEEVLSRVWVVCEDLVCVWYGYGVCESGWVVSYTLPTALHITTSLHLCICACACASGCVL